jgi:CTP:molybdopterin cytidylyltransferase MocA
MGGYFAISASYPICLSQTIHAVVLAAGVGDRLGYPKAALKVAGRWLLPDLILAFRAAGAQTVTLVLSKQSQAFIADLGPTHADLEVLNPSPDEGKTSSILRGLEKVPVGDAVWIHPCDTPLVQAESLLVIRKAWENSEYPDQLLARPVSPANRGGHPLLLGSHRVEELRKFRPQQSLRELLLNNPKLQLNVKISPDPGPFLNINTPEQLGLVEELLKKATP